jgi:hypothetical protein
MQNTLHCWFNCNSICFLAHGSYVSTFRISNGSSYSTYFQQLSEMCRLHLQTVYRRMLIEIVLPWQINPFLVTCHTLCYGCEFQFLEAVLRFILVGNWFWFLIHLMITTSRVELLSWVDKCQISPNSMMSRLMCKNLKCIAGYGQYCWYYWC